MKQINLLNTLVLVVISMLLTLVSTSNVNAQQITIRRDTILQEIVNYEDRRLDSQEDIKFYFKLNSSVFEPDFSTNQEQIKQLDKVMQQEDVTLGLDSLILTATASIDGLEKNNDVLARKRAVSVKDFLSKRYEALNSELLQTKHQAEDWAGLRKLVVEDDNVPFKDEVMKVIDDNSRTLDSKEWVLKRMHGGKPWAYLKSNILPKLRYGASVVFFYNVETLRKITYQEVIVTDTIITTIPQPEPIDTVSRIAQPIAKKSNIAIKTNLLYDAALTANIELEIPIKDRWSIGAEYIFPWWSSNKNNYTQRIRLAHLSATYWLGDRTNKEQLTGWNVGLFGGYGDYDIQLWDANGEQGKIINSGISLGYAHSIAKNLHLHYQIGLGYAELDYKEYQKMWNTEYGDVKVFDYPWKEKRREWYGLTQAEVSLVWMLNLSKKK